MIPESVNQDFDDSINLRVSNPSEEASLKLISNAQLFKGSSIQESDKDIKSGHFYIVNSPK